MVRTVELRRHTDADGDVLTADGVRMAVEIGRRLPGAYDVLISSGAQRATQTAACFLAGMGRAVTAGVIVNSGFRSKVEERWFAAARSAQGKDLNAFRKVDADLVDQEAKLLGAALKSVFESLRDNGSALNCRPLADHRGRRVRPNRCGRRAGRKGRRSQGRRGRRPL